MGSLLESWGRSWASHPGFILIMMTRMQQIGPFLWDNLVVLNLKRGKKIGTDVHTLRFVWRHHRISVWESSYLKMSLSTFLSLTHWKPLESWSILGGIARILQDPVSIWPHSWDRVTAQILTVKLVLAGKKSNLLDKIPFTFEDGSSVFNSGPNSSMVGSESAPTPM